MLGRRERCRAQEISSGRRGRARKSFAVLNQFRALACVNCNGESLLLRMLNVNNYEVKDAFLTKLR